MTIEEFEAGIRSGEVVAETPVEVEGRWIAAREWPTWGALRESPEAQLHGLWTRRSVPWVTALTVALTVQAFRLQGTTTGSRFGMVDELARDTTGVLERGEGWRLLTSALLHADPSHILSNAAAIVVAGWALETMIGHRGVLAVLATSIVAGSALSTVLSPDVASVGISGGDFGLLGACAVLGLRYLDLIPVAARAAFGTTAAFFTVWAFVGGLSGERVDNWCHFGGLMAGLLMGGLYRPRVRAWEAGNRWVDAGALAVVVTLVAVPAVAGPRLVPWTEWDADGAQARRPSWWTLQVGRSGMGGYGNNDRSTSISIDTTRHEHPVAAAAVLEEALGTVKRLDAAATLLPRGPDRATLRYHTESEARVVELRVFTRGLYTTTAAVDSRLDARFAPALRAAVLESLTLDTPDDLADDLDHADSGYWMAQLEGAVAYAALGDVDAASEGFARARTGGSAATVAIAEIGALAALQHPSTAGRIEAALAESPEDRRVRAAAARAWLAFGNQPEALRLAQTLVNEANNPKSLASAEALLRELGGGSGP